MFISQYLYISITMERKNPFEVKFHNELVNLMENLLKIFETDKVLSNSIKRAYLDYKKKYDRFTYIHETVEKMAPFIEAVKRHDESIFCGEEDSINLLTNLNFKPLWGSSLLEDGFKSVIWRHLKNLYVLGCHYVNRQDDHIKQILNQLKFDKLLQKKSDEENESTEQDRSKLTNDILNLFNELFGKDSFIHELIKLEEVQAILCDIKQNPLKTIQKYMNNGGSLIKETLDQISSRVKEKIMSGELDKERIDRDIEKVHRIISKLKSEIADSPKFKKMFDQIKQSFNIDITSDEMLNNPEEMLKRFGQKFESASGMSMEDLSKKSTEELQETIQKMTSGNEVISELMEASGDGESLQQQLLYVIKSIGQPESSNDVSLSET